MLLSMRNITIKFYIIIFFDIKLYSVFCNNLYSVSEKIKLIFLKKGLKEYNLKIRSMSSVDLNNLSIKELQNLVQKEYNKNKELKEDVMKEKLIAGYQKLQKTK